MNSILLPAVSLVAWTLLMQIWMMAVRLPIILKSRMNLDPHAPRGAQMSTLPSKVRWKADNYNNLMEQPTLFYAISLVIAVSGGHSEMSLWLAWAYVGMRVAHSLVQALINNVRVRFAFFMLASVALMLLTISTLRSLLA